MSSGFATWGARTSMLGALLATTCCALPSLLVVLGLGGAVATVVGAVPAVTFLSVHKLWLFAGVGALLASSWAAITGRVPTEWARARLCPVGGAPRNLRRLWRFAVVLYSCSLVVAYLGAPVARLIVE